MLWPGVSPVGVVRFVLLPTRYWSQHRLTCLVQISSLSDPNDVPTLHVVNREQSLQIGYAVYGIVLKVMLRPTKNLPL